MNDDMMFEYLLQMGAMRPEEEQLRKKQAMVDALRKNAMTPMQGEMIGKHYVGPGIGGALSQLGQAYMAKQGQAGVDTSMAGFNDRQRQMLEEMRKRRRMGTGGLSDMSYNSDPYASFGYGDMA
jgi:hypothetical protein